MDGDEAMIVAGIGCRAGCSGTDIVAAVRACLAMAARGADALAVPWFRADLPAVAEAADVLVLPLVSVTRRALLDAQARCRTRSEAALRATGIASVAEGAALAAAGPDAVLLQPRIVRGGATCALAGDAMP